MDSNYSINKPKEPEDNMRYAERKAARMVTNGLNNQPSNDNLLGTDDRGRDVLARLIYGFRLSVVFALALTAIGIVIGLFFGAIQGYFAGRIDLYLQRFIEIWGSMPELYILIIFASIFEPSILLLIFLLSLLDGLAYQIMSELNF